MNATEGKLADGIDCKACRNKGVFYTADADGNLCAHECKCMPARRSYRKMRKSGLGDMIGRYTFGTWETPETWQKQALGLARRYVRGNEGWFLASGQSGSGKTHLCTAISVELLKRNIEIRYMLWRDLAVKAKALVNTDEYHRILQPLKDVPVLYIDDMYKTGKGQSPTTADVNLAFELINYRYNDETKRTIISTERTLDELMSIDEAVGSRIYERSKGYRLDFSDKQNWRLRD